MRIAYLSAVFLSAAVLPRLCAAEVFKTRFVDGLGRPLEGVRVSIETETHVLTRGLSDAEGRIRLHYDMPDGATAKDIGVSWDKEGFGGASTSLHWSIDAETTLSSEKWPTYGEIARMAPEERVASVRELLASDVEFAEDEGTDPFPNDDLLRGPLRALVIDPKVGRAAVILLAQIGDRSDIDFILAHQPAIVSPSKDYDEEENVWAYAVATALIEPEAESHWEFLERAASGAYFELWSDEGAIATLAYSANPRARAILDRAAKANPDRASEIHELVVNGPLPAEALRVADPVRGAMILGCHAAAGLYLGADPPVFDQGRNKVRISMKFGSGIDLLRNHAVYERMSADQWQLRSFIEYSQAMYGPDTTPPGAWYSPCDDAAAK
jgi:hypothetical protein